MNEDSMRDEHKRSNSYDKSWSQPNAVKFFSSCRNSIEEVYDSEKYFLTQVLKPGYSILDIGCAAGGFYNIFKHIEPTISYTGVDLSPEMIKKLVHFIQVSHFTYLGGMNSPSMIKVLMLFFVQELFI